MNAPHKLEADSIQLEFGDRKILTDIYLFCETGSITGLLGRNGQGKTCLLNIIYGTLRTDNKSIRFDNQSKPLAYLEPQWLVYLPQFNFVPGFMALQRVFLDFELDFGEFEKRFPEFSGRGRAGFRDLSGGQRRFAEIYLTTKSPARFVMLDEPFSHLMPIQIEKVKELLSEEKKNKGILITDHLYEEILDCSDRVYLLSQGKTWLAKNLEDIERLGYIRSIR